MDIQIKFSINDKVYLVERGHKQEWTPCAACEGTGRVELKDGVPRMCPECYGRKGRYRSLSLQWCPKQTLTIGSVQVKLTNIESDGTFDNVGHFKEGATTREVFYMAYETGVGAGTLWNEKDLFASPEEAQAECDRRNAEDDKVVIVEVKQELKDSDAEE